jgi:hypothetical protein
MLLRESVDLVASQILTAEELIADHRHTSSNIASARPAHVTYAQNLRLASPHELAWFLRWALARVVRLRRTQSSAGETFQEPPADRNPAQDRGLLEWEDYELWRGRERGVCRFPADV